MSRVRRLAINAADHLVGKGRLDAAASILENYLSAHAESPDIVRRLGRIRLQQGRPDLATQLLQRALRLYAETDSTDGASRHGSRSAALQVD
jgi:Flp pilus assembly protein TadD